MECSHAASASGLAAMLLGTARANHNRTMKSVNEATNQAVELVPPEGNCWEGEWGVRFTNLHHLWSHLTRNALPFRFKHKGVTVKGQIVSHGNVFVMTDLPMAMITPDVVKTLNKRGEDFAHKIGHPDTLPKVFIYDVKEKSGREMQCDATCFSEGQQRHSLPGSGAMALGAFLTARGHLPLPEKSRNAKTVFRFTHPSGRLTARVHLFRGTSHWEIHATSFDTPVRLLMYGSLITR
jgi:PrpF protein